MKLFEGREDFQEIVRSTRKHLKLPPLGLASQSNEISEAWGRAYVKESEEMIDSSELMQQEIAINEKVRRREVSSFVGSKQVNLLREKIPNFYLARQAELIIKKFDLPLHFEKHIELYIINGTITAPQHNYAGGPVEHVPFQKQSEVREFPINIYSRLTPDELEELKHYIDVWGRRLPQYQPLQDLDRRLEIEKQYLSRIRSGPEPTTAADLAEEYFSSRKKAYKVRAIVRDLKKLRKERFERRDKK